MHSFQDLKQAPALTLVTLRMQDAFSFEIYVIDERITSLGSFGEALELGLYAGSISRRRFGKHFRQRGFQPGDKKFRLKIDRVDEELA